METPLSILLDQKDVKTVNVTPEDTVLEAVKRMNENKVGAVMVLTGDTITGVFTERDVLVKIIGADKDPATTKIAGVMTSPVQTVPKDMRVAGAMKLMTEKNFRHLPVIDEDGKLLGLISIGDLTKWVSAQQEAKIKDLENYILGQ